MLKYSFFNAVLDSEGVPDRAFDAGDFSKYFSTLIKNGIFPNPSSNFQIMGDQNNMTVKAEAGLAWVNGHLAYDDSVYILKIDTAESALDRIDRIVLRLDTLERCIKWVVKKGDFSGNPTPKPLQRDADAYEIAIADVRVNHGATSITQSAITDLRMNTELCGWVTGTVTQIDTTTLFNQLEQWKAEYIASTNSWTSTQEQEFLNWRNLFEGAANTWRDGEEKKFVDWFNSIKGQLQGDIATNLNNRVNELENKINTMQLTADNVSINTIAGLNKVGGTPATNVQEALEAMWNEINGQATRLSGINDELSAEIGNPV